MRRLGWVILLGAMLSGCAQVQLGRDFDAIGFDRRVIPGQTTQVEVRAWLGKPTATGARVEQGGREMEWVYYFGSGEMPSLKEAQFKLLQVRFSPAGVVTGYSWSQ